VPEREHRQLIPRPKVENEGVTQTRTEKTRLIFHKLEIKH